MKRLILAGGSGFLGAVLAKYFVARGWEVVVLTRHVAGRRQNSLQNGRRFSLSHPMGEGRGEGSSGFGVAYPAVLSVNARQDRVRAVQWDGETLGDWARELDGAGAVINLAGVSVNCRYGARNRKLIIDSRVNSTGVLGEVIARCAKPPPVWLNSSTATIYKHTFGPAWDEGGEIGGTPEAKDEFSVEVARAWEQAFHEAATPSTRKIALRSAMVLGSGGNSVFPMLRRLVRLGLGGRMGSGTQFVSWIHEKDFCTAIDRLLTYEDFSGIVNLAAPNPVTNAEMMRTLRVISGVRPGLPASRWMLEVGAFFLRTETELIIKSRRVVPGRLLDAGFKFHFPHLREAFEDLISTSGLADLPVAAA